MPLGMEVGLDPSDIVLDGDPAPPSPIGGRAPNFRPMSIVAEWLHGSRYTWYGVGLGPGHIVLDEDPTPPPPKGAQAPNFWPMSVVVKWLDGSRCHLVQR